MGQKQDSRFCPHCKKQVMAIGSTPNHVLHLILTLLTVGLWAIVWILIAAGSIGGFRCTGCGIKV